MGIHIHNHKSDITINHHLCEDSTVTRKMISQSINKEIDKLRYVYLYNRLPTNPTLLGRQLGNSKSNRYTQLLLLELYLLQ